MSLIVGHLMEMVDQNNGIVDSTTRSNYYVRILSTIHHELLKPSASIFIATQMLLLMFFPPEVDSSISLLSQSKKPNVTYNVSVSAVLGVGKPLPQQLLFGLLEARV